ncbi:MAG: hypothetical protein JRI70_07485 [Deltaproteobacteria bacterium]|nr:hypothetical protein [Deltaproteobacteria bacterium]
MKDTYTILEAEDRNAEELKVFFRVNGEDVPFFRGSVIVPMTATKEAAIYRIQEAAYTQLKAKRDSAIAERQAEEAQAKLEKSKKILLDYLNGKNGYAPLTKPKEKKRQLAPPVTDPTKPEEPEE